MKNQKKSKNNLEKKTTKKKLNYKIKLTNSQRIIYRSKNKLEKKIRKYILYKIK